MCHRRRWRCRQDLPAHFLHQQYFPYGLCPDSFRQFQRKCCGGW
ncbi:hypothetical protein CXB51_005611 [Gossypium anomalum]|uniref:Uncharacterized protein n=1 Tax=Gossypium anomalum TaxID=47600 RepID=A0A8J5ZMP6_9ROSI|nr:hypothetical protein CXB51_005611 [Gossypium anomalum]